jgi:hypothetical protein
VNGATFTSNCSPLLETIWYDPSMTPKGVPSGHPDVYSKDSPGCSVGCLPTTPGPRTSSTWPVPSVMIQCRVTSFTGSDPSFEIVTV